MMKKRKIQTLFILGAMLFAFTSSTIVKAEEKESMESYVEEELQGYLAGFGHNTSENVEISQGYEVAGSEDNEYAYFVFDDEEMVGEFMVHEVDGQYISCFNYGKIDEIQEAYDNPDEKIAIAKTEEDVVVYSAEAEEAVSISGENVGEEINLPKNDIDIVETNKKEYLVIDNEYVKDEKETVFLDNVSDKKKVKKLVETAKAEASYSTISYSDVTQVQKLRSLTFIQKRAKDSKTKKYVFKAVPFVKNDSVNKKGICWAASGASIIKYRGIRTALKAIGVFNALEREYGEKYGTPKGSIAWCDRMWKYYGLSMNYNNHKFSKTEVYNALNNNRPMYCHFSNYTRSNGKIRFLSSHAVVLCGAYYYNSKLYYVYMDPNTASGSEYVVNSVVTETADTASGFSFMYYNGESSYNNWTAVYW